MKKRVITCKISKRDAYLATLRQQTKEQQLLALKLNEMALEQLTLKELQAAIKLNEKSIDVLKQTLQNPKETVQMLRLGLSYVKNIL